MNIIRNIFISTMLVVAISGYSAAHPANKPLKIDVVKAQEVSTPAPQVTYPPVEEYVRLKFGVWGDKAVTMLKTCENKFMKVDALNWNGDGSYDYGLFQINSVHGYTKEQLGDYKFNTDVAWKMFVNAGFKFTDWTCSYVVGDKSFWQ